MSAATTAGHCAEELRSICGAEHVVETPPERILGLAPAAAVYPVSVDEVAAIIRFANEHDLAVTPAGGLTQQFIGNRPHQVEILLYTTRLRDIEHYDPADLTIGVGAGWTVADLAAKVAADNLLFAGDPAQPEQCTVGGLLATGLYGPHRHGYGSLRDYCIGVRFVTGDGRKGKGGGRVVKNVAGYDMMKLLIGSYGTLGVITSASFKLFPAPRQTRSFVSCFKTAGEALEFRHKILRSPLDPICLELLSPEASEVLTPGSPAGAWWSICLRAAGSDTVLARYRAELGSAVAHEMAGDNEQKFWQLVCNFAPAAQQQHPEGLLFSLTLAPNDVASVLSNSAAIAESGGFKLAAIGRVGVGHLVLALWPASGQGTVAGSVQAITQVRDRLPGDASMIVLSCPMEVRQQVNVWGPTPNHFGSAQAVKKALDPNAILNRERFFF